MTSITIYEAKWCGSCAQLVPVIRKLAKKKGIPLKVIDVEKCGKDCNWVGHVPLIKIGNREITDLNELARILT